MRMLRLALHLVGVLCGSVALGALPFKGRLFLLFRSMQFLGAGLDLPWVTSWPAQAQA